jgi:hypothetical protein
LEEEEEGRGVPPIPPPFFGVSLYISSPHPSASMVQWDSEKSITQLNEQLLNVSLLKGEINITRVELAKQYELEYEEIYCIVILFPFVQEWG